jgi:hypothetical protein
MPFVELVVPQTVGKTKELTIFMEVNPKWLLILLGRYHLEKDANGKLFIASCQGLGASVWWPNKDHMYDEVDNMLICECS